MRSTTTCKALKGSKIAILGMAYKRDIDDVRESPALDIHELLEEKGAHVTFNDPYVPTVRLSGDRMQHSVELTAEWLAAQDCVVIVTDHKVYDDDFILKNAKLVVDTRNTTNGHRVRRASCGCKTTAFLITSPFTGAYGTIRPDLVI